MVTVSWWEIDFEHHLATVELTDGRRSSIPMAEKTAVSADPIVRARFDVDRSILRLAVSSGDLLTVEIAAANDAAAHPADRPVVYLDQLHWVALAQRRYAPDKLDGVTARASAALIELVEGRELVTPLAASHLVEMGHLDRRWRRDLGLTLMALSRGWQMRNPVAVRAEEFVRCMRGDSPRAHDVFTLQPEVLFAGAHPPPQAVDLPHPFDELLPRLTWATALYAAALDDEPVAMDDGHAAAERWAAGFPPLAQYMRDHKTSATNARIASGARLIADLGEETAVAAQLAGLSPEEYLSWLKNELPSRLPEMPYVGRLHEVLYHRLRNADDRWERNDLIDMNFLCCAGGYAAIVVGEKQTSEYLRRAESRSVAGATVCRTLAEAVNALRELDIAT